APEDAPSLFDAATDDPALALTLAYPATGTVFPSNLGEFDVHWRETAGVADLFEVHISGAHIDLKTYTTGTPSSGNWTIISPSTWLELSRSAAGGPLTVSVRGLSSANPASVGAS